MRIAVSGSHATGKSTLVADLNSRLEGFVVVEEPYYTLMSEGHAFGHPPTVDDFQLLVERATDDLHRQQGDRVLFDRSPADYLAYVTALDGTAIATPLLQSARAALCTLDFVVYVGIDHPDRIAAVEMPKLRRKVDRIIAEMFLDNSWDFNVPVVQVHGSSLERLEQVMERIRVATETA